MYFEYILITIGGVLALILDLFFSQSIFLNIFSATGVLLVVYWLTSSKSFELKFGIAFLISVIYGLLLNQNLAILLLPLMIMQLLLGILEINIVSNIQNLIFSLGFFMIYDLLYLNLANLDPGLLIVKVILNTLISYFLVSVLARILSRNNKYHKLKNANFRY